MNFHWG